MITSLPRAQRSHYWALEVGEAIVCDFEHCHGESDGHFLVRDLA